MVGRKRLPRGASDSIYHQGVNGSGGIVGEARGLAGHSNWDWKESWRNVPDFY